MSLSSNAFYQVQSFGTDYNLAAGDITGGSGSIVAQSSGIADNALWQLTRDGSSPYALRTKEYGLNFNGNAYCMNTGNNSIVPVSGPCTRSSLVWRIEFWNGRNAQDGYYLTSTDLGDDFRLYTDPDIRAISMRRYNSSSSNDDVYMQWGFRSTSEINDSQWSAFPPTGMLISTTTSSSSLSSSSSSSTRTGTGEVTSSSATGSTSSSTTTTTSTTMTTTTSSSTMTTTTAVPSPTTTTPISTSTTSSSLTTSSTSSPSSSSLSSTSTSSTPTSIPEGSTVVVTVRPTVTATPTTTSRGSQTSRPAGLVSTDGPNAGKRSVSLSQSLLVGFLGSALFLNWIG